MAARVMTVAFQGVEARPVDVEVQLTSGEFAFVVVGLGDKAVAGSGSARPSQDLASPCPVEESSAIWRRRTFQKKAATMIFPLPWRSWPPWGSFPPTP